MLTILLAKDKDELEDLAVSVEERSKNFGLMINRAKTNVMTVHGEGVVKIGETELEVVDKFKYLGSVITPTEPSAREIRTRLAHAKSVTSKLDNVWRSSKLSKKRLGKALVWSVALYGCESWTLRQRDEDMITAFEMWFWRRILRINWHDKLSNEWVRTRLGLAAKNELLAVIRKRKLANYCH